MSYRVGSGYEGSQQLETTTEEYFEVIPYKENRRPFYKFSFLNDQDCTIKINNVETIFLRENQGFNSDYYDKPIHSFVISEKGIQYNWIGAW